MSSMGAVYAQVPAGGVPALEQAVKAAREKTQRPSPLGVLAFDPAVHRFAVVDRWGPSDDMPSWSEGPDLDEAVELVELSRAVGEVFAFYEVDEGLTMGLYATWLHGERVRALEWANDQWCRVEGEPQHWEAPLFGPELLERALENARDRGQEEEAIRTLFTERRILLEARLPVPDALSGFFRTTGPGPAYGFEPWPRRRELEKQLR